MHFLQCIIVYHCLYILLWLAIKSQLLFLRCYDVAFVVRIAMGQAMNIVLLPGPTVDHKFKP